MFVCSVFVVFMASAFVAPTHGFLAHGWTANKIRIRVSTQEEQSKSSEQKPSVAPYFKIKDWDAALPLMKEFDDVAAFFNLPEFGWSMNEDNKNMVFRATLNNEDELAEFYVDALSPLIDKLILKAAAIDHVDIVGLTEKFRVDIQNQPFETKHYKLEEGFFSKLGTNEELPKEMKIAMVRVKPFYTLNDEKKARVLMAKIVEMARTEEDCLFFAWHVEDNKVACDGCFTNAKAFAAHINNINPYLKELLAGPATLNKLEIYARKNELEKTKSTTAQSLFRQADVQEYSTGSDRTKVL